MSDQSLTVCILGMHRSGTSCLTGSLEQAGLRLGDVHTWNPYNLRGNRENQAVVDFHEALLAANGASWDKPPRKLSFDEQDIARARELVAQCSAGEPWGFKDPRALLALSLWQQAVPSMRYIGIFRHPLAVAESISHRAGGKISIRQGVALWHDYNLRLYQAWRELRFPILCFDWEEQQFHQRLAAIQAGMGLTGTGEEERFYSSDLKHFDTSRWNGVSWRSRWLYKKLAAACD